MIGTPGFVAKRLTEAREARGLPASVLAELVGVTPASISQYEAGKTSPRPEVMRLVAEKLNLPESFFKRPIAPSEVTPEDVIWRSLSYATKAARLRCRRRLVWLENMVVYLRQFLDLPLPRIPDFGINDPARLTAKDIEMFAADTRSEWGLGDGPIADLTLLLENHGVIVSRIALNADGLDAFSRWSRRDGAPYMILGADKRSAVRSRYDAAHELGHLVLHRAAGSLDHKTLEAQAFRFASAFLVPEGPFVSELWAATLDAFRSLKDRWLVSIGVMIKRCEELEIINEEQAQRMWIGYTRRGWKRVEPLDDVIPPEQPRLLRRSVELLVNDSIRSRPQILLDIPYAAADIEELARLSPGFLRDTSSEIGLPRIREGGGAVVQFPGTRKSPPSS